MQIEEAQEDGLLICQVMYLLKKHAPKAAKISMVGLPNSLGYQDAIFKKNALHC